jgi:hypothetical protein
MKIKKINLLILIVFFTTIASAKEYHVSVKGSDKHDGSSSKPFRTINHAAQLAKSGDIVTVHAGTYREWVNPAHGGESDSKRIVYQAASGEKVEIKGSEVVTGWKKERNGLWKVIIPNSFFGMYNSCADFVNGDWCNNPDKIHTADLFLNGKWFFEVDSISKVINPSPFDKCQDKEGFTYIWYCETDANKTTIWANFQHFDPNKELVELSIRKTCFYPEKQGLNYITIRGFDINQAATQWAPPTAEQVGMVGTNWNKGWIIENNTIQYSKCVGITLGKYGDKYDNKETQSDGGYEGTIKRALAYGWNKENIGGHLVRNNTIAYCEQAGICGSMGAAFCTIENNHIHDIWTKRQCSGSEMGGIKIHGAIDVRIEHNRIHNTCQGIWLDWMAQGIRITRNLMYNNSGNMKYENDWDDIFMEVNHGPILIDNNILLSPLAISSVSQGVAVAHNLIAGRVRMYSETGRQTPYFLPHLIEIAGMSPIYSGDERYFNNIFWGIGGELEKNDPSTCYGLAAFTWVKSPVWSGNTFYGKALPSKDEMNFIRNAEFKPEFTISEDGNGVYLIYSTDKNDSVNKTQLITTELLGKTKISKQSYENSDGSTLKIDTDYFGNKRSESSPAPGPFENQGKGALKLKVW